MAARKKPARAEKAAPPEELPTLSFRAKLTRGDTATGSWRWIDIPERVSKTLSPWAKAGHVRVDATLDGVALQGSLSPRGGGRHLMLLNAAIRREAGITDDRTTAIEVTVTPRITDAVRLPDDFAAALDAEDARDRFEALSSSHRWELVRYVLGARTDATRARYIARSVDHVLGRASTVEAPAKKRVSRGWHCPECGKHFAKVDAEHPCERISIDVPFAGKDPSVRSLYEALREKVESLTHCTLAMHKEGVSFIGRRRFLWAIPRKGWLELRLIMTRRVEAPNVRSFTSGPSVHVNTVRVRSDEEIDAQSALIREAIAYGAPVDTGRSEPKPTSDEERSGWDRDVDDSFFEGLDEM